MSPSLPSAEASPTGARKRLSGFFHSRLARFIFTGLALAASLSALGYLVYRQKDVLLAYRWNLSWPPVVWFFGLFTINLLLVTQIWVWIIHALGARLDFRTHFRYFTISNLMKRLPGTVWYMAWRAQMYGQQGLTLQVTTLASGVELAIFVVSGLLVSMLFAVPTLLRYRAGIWTAAVLLVISLAFLHPRVLGWLLKRTGLRPEQLGYRRLLLWTAAYAITRLIGGSMLFCVANIFVPVPLQNLGYVIGSHALVGVLATALLFAPTNLGFSEIGLSLLLSSIMPSSIAVVVAVANRVLDIVGELVWALLSLWIESASKKAH